MFSPFSFPYVQRGVYEVLLLSAGAGVLGTWIVLRGLAFYAHAVGTAAFPGLVLADGLGFAATLGAGATGAGVAVAVGVLARRPGARERYDSLTALVLVGALAIGVILSSDVFGSGASIESLLFGSLLLVDHGDLVFAGVASALVLAASAVFGQRWLITGFDPENARALGVRSGAPDMLLLAAISLLAIAALATLGALLSTALLVVPAATTRLLCTRLGPWQSATVALVALEGVAGLWISVKTNAPPGAAIAVLSSAVFAMVALARPVLRSARARRAGAGAVAVAALALVGSGCGSDDTGTTNSAAAGAPAKASVLPVVATTTQLGDFTRNVGGDAVKVTQILKPNTDPHDYEPRPQDVNETAGAKLVIESGDNLDKWMANVVKQSGSSATVIDTSGKLAVTRPGESSGAEASKYDPHWWHDPRNAETAVGEIRDALTAANPSGRATYAQNATAYLAKLKTLDAGVKGCIDTVPAAQRKLVTDHDAFGYFADHYGITIVGAVIPSQTTQAQASAGDLAKLAALIKQEQVKAVFPESSVNPKVAEAIAKATGASAKYTLYGDTLGAAGSPGATYLTMERANADAMVKGFTGGSGSCAITGI